MKKYYINKIISYCYPYDYSRITRDYGVLQQYMGREYNQEEIDKIICELIIRHPYVENSMQLDINIMWENQNASGYYHILTFRNDNYDNQTKSDLTIKYEK